MIVLTSALAAAVLTLVGAAAVVLVVTFGGDGFRDTGWRAMARTTGVFWIFAIVPVFAVVLILNLSAS